MSSATAFDFNSLMGLVDESQLGFTEEAQEGINRARLIQGDASLEKDSDLNKTVRYSGGIGLSMDGLPEEIIARGKVVVLENGGDFVTFPFLDAVVLASSRIRRLYLEVDGERKNVCGSNHVGQSAKGFNGDACASCKFFPKNVEAAGGEDDTKCKASVTALVYFPELDHTAIFSAGGSSYIEADEWLRQVSTLSKKLAEQPGFKDKGIARVNSYFFRTTLSASEFHTSPEGKRFNKLRYGKAVTPYNWVDLINSPAVIQKAGEILKEMESAWHKMYVEPHTAILPSSAPTVPAIASTQPLPALPAAAPAPAEAQPAAAKPLPKQEILEPEMVVNTIALEDSEDAEEVIQGF